MSEGAAQALVNVSETLLIPLYVRAQEAARADALLRDGRAAALVEGINYDFSRIVLADHDRTLILMRAREFDRFAREFLARHAGAVVVHIGCGLDTRFERVDDGRVEWFDVDLPEVIALRRRLAGEASDGNASSRYNLLAGSVLESDWLEAVSGYRGRPFLFVAEGVLVYFPEAQVKALFLTLRDRFPGAELVTDAMTPFMVRVDNLHLLLSRMRARLHWGLRRGRDVESWGEDIRLLEEWFYFDRPEPRLGSAQWMHYFPPFGRGAGIFHYRLGQAQEGGAS